ncbi:MAG TPA: YibE/F family protein [Actinomycetota bacterium]
MLGTVAAAIAAATVLGIIALRPRGEPDANLRELGIASDVYGAAIESVEIGPCPGTEEAGGVRCRLIGARLLQGPDEGQEVTISLSDTPSTPSFEVGEEIVLAHTPEAQEGFRYQLADRQRRPVLWILFALFVVAVVVLGGIRGMAALAGLAASVVLLILFVLPSILDGRSPLAVAVVGASAIAFLALYLAHGFTLMTTVALLGTVASLALTTVLAELFVRLARLTGLATEEATIVQVGAAEIDLAGLILGGVVIGALGAIDDMTVTQASTVWELHGANPRLGRRGLFRSGMRVGRDHVASTVNTLLLAYAGASIPLLLLFVLSEQSLGTVANSEVVATEIVRTLVGSIGLVASVPITTWLASWVMGASPAPEGA